MHLQDAGILAVVRAPRLRTGEGMEVSTFWMPAARTALHVLTKPSTHTATSLRRQQGALLSGFSLPPLPASPSCCAVLHWCFTTLPASSTTHS